MAVINSPKKGRAKYGRPRQLIALRAASLDGVGAPIYGDFAVFEGKQVILRAAVIVAAAQVALAVAFKELPAAAEAVEAGGPHASAVGHVDGAFAAVMKAPRGAKVDGDGGPAAAVAAGVVGVDQGEARPAQALVPLLDHGAAALATRRGRRCGRALVAAPTLSLCCTCALTALYPLKLVREAILQLHVEGAALEQALPVVHEALGLVGPGDVHPILAHGRDREGARLADRLALVHALAAFQGEGEARALVGAAEVLGEGKLRKQDKKANEAKTKPLHGR